MLTSRVLKPWTAGPGISQMIYSPGAGCLHGTALPCQGLPTTCNLERTASTAQQQPPYAAYSDFCPQLTCAALCRTLQRRAPCSSVHWPTSSCKKFRTSSGSRGCPQCQGEQPGVGLQLLLWLPRLALELQRHTCGCTLKAVASGVLCGAVLLAWRTPLGMALWHQHHAGLGHAASSFSASWGHLCACQHAEHMPSK